LSHKGLRALFLVLGLRALFLVLGLRVLFLILGLRALCPCQSLWGFFPQTGALCHADRFAGGQMRRKKKSGNKKPARGGFFRRNQTESLQLDFLVLNVLASFGVELHDRHLLGHGFFVFAGRVKVTSPRCGLQLDFFASAFACHGV